MFESGERANLGNAFGGKDHRRVNNLYLGGRNPSLMQNTLIAFYFVPFGVT